MYYFYILQNKYSDLYYGSTNDLKRRFSEHNSEKSIKKHGQAKRWLKERIINSLQ